MERPILSLVGGSCTQRRKPKQSIIIIVFLFGSSQFSSSSFQMEQVAVSLFYFRIIAQLRLEAAGSRPLESKREGKSQEPRAKRQEIGASRMAN